jgi:protocatechuate 3,4-dioxygenase alpha subunit
MSDSHHGISKVPLPRVKQRHRHQDQDLVAQRPERDLLDDRQLPVGGEGARPYGYGRVSTSADGSYTIETVMPGSFKGPGGETYAPQISVTIFARGLLKGVQTRVFLASLDAIKDDPLARALGNSDRLSTLVATRDPNNPKIYRWNVQLQGGGETVFIDA